MTQTEIEPHAREAAGSVRTPVCVTRWSALATRLQDRLGPVHIADHLAGLYVHAGHRVVIIDTKVGDLDNWPAPLLLNSAADQLLWIFLFTDVRDVQKLYPLPPSSAFFSR